MLTHGARAVAIGRDIYMGEGQLDIETADGRELIAHEVAHVVQAESKPDRLATKRDHDDQTGAAEAEADDFAARFRTEGSRARFTPTVDVSGAMRKAESAKPGKTQPHWDYVREHLTKILEGIELRVTRLPQPHPRLRWVGDGGKTVFARIQAHAEVKPEHAMLALAKLVAPADLWSVVDEARRGPAGTKLEVLRLRVGTAFEEAVLAALPRMGMRAVVQWDRKQGAPDLESLVASSPLDELLAGVLADKSAVTWAPRKLGARDDTEAKAFKTGTRHVTFQYVGERDASLWNWIKVTAPVDATAEDVASTPLGHKLPPLGSDQAYRFAVSPPYFGVPIEAARHIDELTRHMTVETLAKVRKEAAEGGRPLVDIADPRALRDSKIADEAALAQAPNAPKQLEPGRALGRVRLQADDVAHQMARHRYRNVVAPALQFIARREKDAADPKRLARWAGVLEAQERLLHDVASELREVVAAIEKQNVKPDDVARNPPVRDLLLAYARAAGQSHLHAEGPAALAEARRLRGRLALSQAEHQIRQARRAGLGVDAAIANQRTPDGSREPHADETAMALQMLTWSDQQIRGKLARGEKVTDDEIQDLQLDASEAELRGRLAALSTNLRDLRREADSLGLTGKRYGTYSVAAACDVMLRKINGSTEAQQQEDQRDTTKGGWHAWLDDANKVTVKSQRRQARAKAIREVNADLEAFSRQVDLQDFFKKAQGEIQHERMRQLINDILLQIGLAVLTGEAIGALGIAIRGIAIAGEIGAEIRNASLAWEAASVVGQAAANTAINGAMGGPIDARTFAENGLAIVLTSAAMKPFQRLFEGTSGVESQIVSWGRTAAKGGRLAAELVIETGVGIGAAGVAHAVTHGGQVGAQDAESWVTMGLSVAATRYVGKRTEHLKARLASAVHELGSRTAPQFEALAKRADKVHRLAGGLGSRDPKTSKPPTPEEALGLLRKHHELVKAEHELYVKEHPNDKRRKANEADATSDAQLLDVSLQLSHLSPVIDGHVYEGSEKQIQAAFKAADEIGVPTRREWIPERDVWRVTSGKRTVEIHETLSASTKPKPHEARQAAEEVPGSSFKGQNPGVPEVTLAQVQTAADEAMTILNYDTRKHSERYWRVGDKVYITEGHSTMEVEFRVGAPSTGPARHNYVKGANKVTVTVSKEARAQDLRRALAHELAELHAIVADPASDRPSALHETSHPTSSTELAAHDVGRVAELRVLLHELAYAPATRTKETRAEIDKLIEHLGFEPRTFGADPRARLIFGEAMLKRAYEHKYVAKNRILIELDPKNHIKDNGTEITETTSAWRMQIELVIDGRRQGLVYATAPLDKGKPLAGPEFSIDNTTVSGGLDQSITLTEGGTPLKLTEFVLEEATARFTKRFGHAPQTLNGHLAQDNKLIFQKAYAAEAQRLKKAGKPVDPKAVGTAAIKETPFYKARERDYEVALRKLSNDWTEILYGDPPELVRVPNDIDIDAVRKK